MTQPAGRRDGVGEQSIAHYRLLARIGSGAMGIVYRAEDTKLRRTVALKVLHPEVADKPDRRRRFLREGRLAAAVTHPCIATVFEVGEADGRVYIAMELVEGELLSTKLKAGPLPYVQALRIAREIARGLARAHEAGVIHRDLKPDNVLIGADDIVKILDFGVAKPTEALTAEFTDIKTQHGTLVGTPAYMSPEQAAGRNIDARSDIFSFGVVLHEMLTGKRPFAGDTWQEVIISINRDPVEPVSKRRPDVPADLDHLLARCLVKSPLDRYRKCRDLLEDIELLLAGSSPQTATRSSIIRSTPPSGSSAGATATLDLPGRATGVSGIASLVQPGARRSAAVGLALGIVLAGSVAWLALRGQRDDGKTAAAAVSAADTAGALAPATTPAASASSEAVASSAAPEATVPAAEPTGVPTAAAVASTARRGPLPGATTTAKPGASSSAKPKNPVLGF